jgi:16S rRNA (uracil1498-N3)-methyltransferase
MASHRFLFYSPHVDADAGIVELDGDEHHHLARVLRLGAGGEAFVTDGRGLMAQCRVEAVGDRRTRLSILSAVTDAAPRDLTLALALIKKDRFAQAFEQCVELGVTRLLPYAADGSRLKSVGAGTVARLERVAVSAMKQSFRSWLPRIDGPVGFDGVINAASRAGEVVVGAQGADPYPRVLRAQTTMVVVGPEAGFSDPEREALEARGARFVSVSPYRLRSETAAVALVAAVLYGD